MKTYSESDWLVALHRIKGIGWHTIDKIQQTCGGFVDLPVLITKYQTELAELRIPWQMILRELESSSEMEALHKIPKEVSVVTVLDDHYPNMLRQIAQPPWVLYVMGHVSLLNVPTVGIVGTRKPTPYGEAVARKLSYQLTKRGLTVASGMARGIDSEAHRGALEAGGPTIAVLGCGVDIVYPKSNRALYREIGQEGTIVSEYPLGTEPLPGLFPQRNRIISGLSRGAIIVEAAEKSGSLITADASLEQNRDVFAIPGPITSVQSVGPNRLIQQGAKCVTDVDDVLEEYPDMVQKNEDRIGLDDKIGQEDAQLTFEEAAVLEHLSFEPVHLDALSERVGYALAELHPILLSLQLKRFAKQLPGSRFIRL